MKFPSSLVAASLLLSGVQAGLQQISNWGTNPGGMALYAYIPNNVAPNPAVILAVRPVT
jgi:acetylxylan esterase